MNKFIKEQLKKCKTKLPDWNDNTTELFISIKSKHSDINQSGNLHIKIENYIINEPSTFTLSSNWNGGTKPPENEMIVEIINKAGKMYKVKGFGINTNINWEGWLPEKGFEILT